MVTANFLVILGILFMLIGLERFAGRLRAQNHNVLLLLLFVFSLSYFTFLEPDLSIRSMIGSAAIILLTGQCAWTML
jgi:hypothetical protein